MGDRSRGRGLVRGCYANTSNAASNGGVSRGTGRGHVISTPNVTSNGGTSRGNGRGRVTSTSNGETSRGNGRGRVTSTSNGETSRGNGRGRVTSTSNGETSRGNGRGRVPSTPNVTSNGGTSRGNGRGRVTSTSNGETSRGNGRGRVTSTSNGETSRGNGRGRVPSTPNVTSNGGTSRGNGRGRVTSTSNGETSRGNGRGRVTNISNAGPSVGTGRNVPSVAEEYVQASSINLPKMNFLKVAEYFQLLRSPELRQAKDSVSARPDYGDNAVGYVRVKRDLENDQSKCTIQARLTPQTSVNKKAYVVSVCLDENSSSILSASCNCQASADGCKHQTALIFWLLRRSDEPAPTETACYWRKSILSTVKDVKAKTTDELCKRSTDFSVFDDSLLRTFIERGKETNKTAFVIKYSECRNKKTLYIDHLTIQFTELETHPQNEFSCDTFLAYCTEHMTPDACKKVFEETMDQVTKAEWYYQRFARITASKLYEVSRCKTPNGSVVAAIMGARGFKGTSATKRGQRLEGEIFELLKKKYPSIKKSGVLLTGELPIFGASPDGLTEDTVFEIKSPVSDATVVNYVDKDELKPKVYFQIQLQMLMSNRKKGILVIADPKFEENKIIREFKVCLDKHKLKPILENCSKFWKEIIFPLLK